MSDAVLKNARVNLEALRRRGQQVNASEVAQVAGLAGHSLTQDEEVTTGAAAQQANRGNAHAKPTAGQEEPLPEEHQERDDDSDRAYQAHGGEVRQVDERTQRVREIAGYPFTEPAGRVQPPRALPGPADIPPTGHGPATPSGQGSVGHRTGGAMSMDDICDFTRIGGR